MSFWTVGINFHRDIQAGLELLSSFGDFDEVLVGRHWINTGLRRYVWDDAEGITRMPQILLIKQHLQLVSEPRSTIEFGPREVLLRLAGYPAIQNWRDSHYSVALDLR